MSAADPIYLDYAATSPVDPLVIEAMNECFGAHGEFANPGSATHLPGRRGARGIRELGPGTLVVIDEASMMSVQDLADIIGHAKSKGLRVILMPIVLLDNPAKETEWRGTLAPTDWGRWFDNYRDMIEHYARIAQSNGVDVLVCHVPQPEFLFGGIDQVLGFAAQGARSVRVERLQ